MCHWRGDEGGGGGVCVCATEDEIDVVVVSACDWRGDVGGGGCETGEGRRWWQM